MDPLLLITFAVSFGLCMYFLPIWIRRCRRDGLLWEDMNKYKHPKNVASSGGIIVVFSFMLGVLTYVALQTFAFSGAVKGLEIFSLLTMVLILGVVGLTDDLLGWKNDGIPRKLRVLLAFMASIPLVVINAGTPTVELPFLGIINFGIFYPLVLIPVGVAGATTVYNFLAGYNGLEAGQGILVLSFLSFVAYNTGNPWLAVVGLCMVASLAAFYVFNKFPAQVFPGDIMTYAVGALIAGMAIIGNFERIAIIVFTPYIIEFFLKLRGGLKKSSFGIPQKDGTLKMPFNKIYGLEHAAIFLLNKMGKATEKKVAYLIFAFQILFILLGAAVLLS